MDKIYKIGEDEYAPFYNYQLAFYIGNNPGKEEAFFTHVHDIVSSRIAYYKGLKPSGIVYAKALVFTAKLEAFLAFLKSVDRWHKTQTLESVISDKNNLIDQLKARIKELEMQQKESAKYEAGEKIVISKGGLPVLIDLVNQIRELRLPKPMVQTDRQELFTWG